MSLLKDNKISVKQFASVPPLSGLPAIMRTPTSASASSCPELGVDLNEGCMVTKLISYTNQLAHFINAVRRGDSDEAENIIEELAIIQDGEFSLDSPCNLAYLEPHIHISLDLYAFVAIVPSSSTLDELINMLKTDNTLRQHLMDKGVKKHRNIDVNAPCHACLPAGYSFHGQVCCAVFYQSTI